MLVIRSTVRIVQAEPPTWNAWLNIANMGRLRPPSVRRQPGTSTIRSRGIDTAVALRWSADRCSRIVVSDRSVPESRP